jgi:hypothetical protein
MPEWASTIRSTMKDDALDPELPTDRDELVNPTDPCPPRPDETRVEARVSYIASLMSKGEWRSSMREYRKLAAAWGCTHSTVRGYAVEAHRMIAWDPDERQGLRRSLAATMDSIGKDALSRFNEKTGLPDYASAITAYEDFARFAGINIEAPEPVDAVDMLSRADLEKRVRHLLGALELPADAAPVVPAKDK